jgi:hypothetical protein
MRLTQISHLLKELGIPIMPHVFCNFRTLITSINNRIYCGTAVAHMVTKYFLAPGMARDGGIDLSNEPTTEIVPNSFTQPLSKPAFLM